VPYCTTPCDGVLAHVFVHSCSICFQHKSQLLRGICTVHMCDGHAIRPLNESDYSTDIVNSTQLLATHVCPFYDQDFDVLIIATHVDHCVDVTRFLRHNLGTHIRPFCALASNDSKPLMRVGASRMADVFQVSGHGNGT
jgi:hypothetical protein